MCYTLYMVDSYGDGWSGSTWHWEDSSGAHTSSGTLSSGASGTERLCIPEGLNCMAISVTAVCLHWLECGTSALLVPSRCP